MFQENDEPRSNSSYRNFFCFSLFCSAVPACVLACLSLAVVQLGSTIGAYQSGILYATFTLSSLLSLSTVALRRLGPLGSVLLGEALLGGGYVTCFAIATVCRSINWMSGAKAFAWIGAAVGGVGAAVFWAAQGVYFSQAASEYSEESLGMSHESASSILAGLFAFWLLVEETVLDLLSTFLVHICRLHWSLLFALYAALAVAATIATSTVHTYDLPHHEYHGVCSEVYSTIDLFVRDSRMKYMVAFNAMFGFAGAYLNSFISGQIAPIVLGDSSFVGLFVALHGGAAAVSSLVLSRCCRQKGISLAVGSISFLGVGLPFLLQPHAENDWSVVHLTMIYILHGIGRATFEGTLKAVFADWFPGAPDAAFTNITLQNGMASALGYFLTTRLSCQGNTGDSFSSHASRTKYCVRYKDGTFHNVGVVALLIVGMSVAALLGYWRAAYITNNRTSRQNLNVQEVERPEKEEYELPKLRGDDDECMVLT